MPEKRKQVRSSRGTAPPPKVALCAGLKSSGSTWLYNAVIQILEDGHMPSKRPSRKEGYEGAVLPFYADQLGSFPLGVEHASYLIIKTHIPAASLQFVARFVGARVFVTIREPRDAIASLLQRFDHSFRGSLKEVSASAAKIVELVRTSNPLILRYEDRFFDNRRTVHDIGTFLERRVSQSRIDAICRHLSRAKVNETIEHLSGAGVFGDAPNPDSFDPKTHWHPGHVGNGLIGKFRTVLTESQQKEVLAATKDYCTMFGYDQRMGSRRKSITNQVGPRKPSMKNKKRRLPPP